jgi:drug/metabolite transporter (DMT)-like permease
VTRWQRVLPWIALIVVYFVWGSTYLGIRVAVATIPPYLMTGCRWVIAGSLLFAIQWLTTAQRRQLASGAELRRAAVTAVLLIAGGNGLLCVAEQHVESGTAALLIAGTPIWMVLIDGIFEQKAPTRSVIAGLLVGTGGTIVLVGNLSRGGEALFAFLILLASLSWALGSVYARGNPPRTFTSSLEMLVGGAVSIAVGLAAGEWSHLRLAAISPASLSGMLWLITAGAMLGYSAYAYAVRTLPTATVATYAYVNPVVAVILGILVLGERVSWTLLAGGAAVVLSVVLILAGSRRTSEEVIAQT